ncbi:unnamed protein product [Phytophthora fragariaefolia]|uniref:Unnamed protein product n=1 Tax=Phytophthora fragariaefolia TaxID=1490495 RepID=A0A9W6XMZ8_9STRA|nr:unnamed protein product [Phytophthora fragariaefolia]
MQTMPQEIVQGQVIISSPKGFSHQGLAMKVEGSTRLQLSTKSAGLFDSFYNNVPPLELVYFHLPVAPAGKVPPGISKFPFEFELQGNDDQELLETYHGVYVSVKYEIVCDCIRGIMKNKLHKTLEFVVEVPVGGKMSVIISRDGLMFVSIFLAERTVARLARGVPDHPRVFGECSPGEDGCTWVIWGGVVAHTFLLLGADCSKVCRQCRISTLRERCTAQTVL